MALQGVFLVSREEIQAEQPSLCSLVPYLSGSPAAGSPLPLLPARKIFSALSECARSGLLSTGTSKCY